MRPEFWAVLTAFCWAIGSLLEKRGVQLGNFAPVMGTTIRTSTSVLLLLVISYPFWGQTKTVGMKPILLIAIGGGLITGCLGIICLYSALKTGQLSIVLTIAFCLTPVVGSLLGYLFLDERLKLTQLLGIGLCIAGAALVTLFKNH
ncbi:MAG: EamA family transporter [Pirellulaceae bacterium]|nr:EamA family transporter [Pirellulaceae bacterium]